MHTWVHRMMGIITLVGSFYGLTYIYNSINHAYYNDGSYMAMGLMALGGLFFLYGLMCGFWLLESTPHAKSANIIFWLMQLPILATGFLSYHAFTLANLGVTMPIDFSGYNFTKSAPESGFLLNLGGGDGMTLGINLFALFMIILLSIFGSSIRIKKKMTSSVGKAAAVAGGAAALTGAAVVASAKGAVDVAGSVAGAAGDVAGGALDVAKTTASVAGSAVDLAGGVADVASDVAGGAVNAAQAAGDLVENATEAVGETLNIPAMTDAVADIIPDLPSAPAIDLPGAIEEIAVIDAPAIVPDVADAADNLVEGVLDTAVEGVKDDTKA